MDTGNARGDMAGSQGFPLQCMVHLARGCILYQEVVKRYELTQLL